MAEERQKYDDAVHRGVRNQCRRKKGIQAKADSLLPTVRAMRAGAWNSHSHGEKDHGVLAGDEIEKSTRTTDFCNAR